MYLLFLVPLYLDPYNFMCWLSCGGWQRISLLIQLVFVIVTTGYQFEDGCYQGIDSPDYMATSISEPLFLPLLLHSMVG